ncbi:hypothetical protein IGJ39_002526 [Enterococcus sp. AZ140]|uniref:Ig-like domain repeat protein n=1 Tax=Enterococcus sp. AZ140 TaxID=2774731 RepID=UPI003F1EE79A
MKAKKIRIIATSFLLFQQALLPSVVMAIENESIANTEIMEEQPESHLSEEATDVVEEQAPITHEEPEVVVETPEAPPEVAEEVPPMEAPPEAPATEETIETVETQEEVPPLDESPLSVHLGRLNLTAQNVAELTNHGRSSYIQAVLQNAINRTITLGNAANSTATFSVTVPTHSMVQRQGTSNGWISSIVTDSTVGMPDELYTQMYYGNHSTHRNTYTLTNISSSNAAVSVSATVTINSNFTSTINFTVTRVQAASTTVALDIRGNVGLGTTGVATQFTHIATPRHVMNLSYTGETIGQLTVNAEDEEEVPTVGVHANVTVQATRSQSLSQEVIQSWFHTLPGPGNWSFSTSNLGTGWFPGYTNQLPVYLINNSTGGITQFWTTVTVVDTEAPTGMEKTEWTDIQANRHRDFNQEELRSVINNLQDNWSTLSNIRMAATRSLTELVPNSTNLINLNATDESGNTQNFYETRMRIIDTLAPTGTVKSEIIDLSNVETSIPSRSEIMQFLNNDLEDNWTLRDEIIVQLLDSNGEVINLQNLEPSNSVHTGYIRLEDEFGNQSALQEVRFNLRDIEGPTANVTTTPVDFEATRVNDLTKEDIMKFFIDDPVDNSTPTDQIDISLIDSSENTVSISNVAPSITNVYDAAIRLTDEFGNFRDLPVTYRVIDTKSPDVTTNTTTRDLQARRIGGLERSELLPFVDSMSDNWTLNDDIKLSLLDSLGTSTSIAGVAPNLLQTYTGFLNVEDEAGNANRNQMVNYRVIDTQAPTGSAKGTWTVFEANRHRDFTQDELRLLFHSISDNWTLSENIRLESHRRLYVLSPNEPSAYHPMDITAIDEAGNEHIFRGTMPRIVDTTAPTANFKNEVIDFSTLTSNTFSRTDLLRFFNGTPEDNWTLPENIRIELVDSQGNEFALDDLEFQEYTGYIRLEDQHGNRTDLQEVKFLAGDNEGPTGNVVTQPVDFQARRVNELSRADLLRFFTEDPLDNTTATDQIDLSLRNNNGEVVSIVNVAPSTAIYDANVRLQDIRGNYTEYPVNYRVVDTQAPTGSINQEITIFEATRTRDFTQEELRSLLIDLEDNWTERESITLKNNLPLHNLRPNSIGEWYFQVHVDATDEAGNTIRIENTKVRIEDTTAPDGTLKDPLVFTKGQTAPSGRDFLDGDPTDNWSLSPDIQVEVTYEDNVQFADLAVGDHGVTITLTDQAGNARTLNSQVTILEDTSEYIDVTIPMNVSFAQSKESNGIVSPTYQIQNNAERAVQVSVSSVVSQSNTEQLTEIDLGVKNNLNDNQVMLISSGQNLNNRRELGTIEGRNTSFSFSLFGTVGENFDFESLNDPLSPVYSMRLNFNAKE